MTCTIMLYLTHVLTVLDPLQIEEENAALLAALTDSLDGMVDAEVGGLSVFPALGEEPDQEEEEEDNLPLATEDYSQSLGAETEDPSLVRSPLYFRFFPFFTFAFWHCNWHNITWRDLWSKHSVQSSPEGPWLHICNQFRNIYPHLRTLCSPQILSCFFFITGPWFKKSLAAQTAAACWSEAFHTCFKHHPLPPLAPATLCLSFAMLSHLFLPSISICVAFANLDVPLVGPQGSKSAFNSRKTEESGTQWPFIQSGPMCVSYFCISKDHVSSRE